jgi:hypothetical protein
MRISRLIAISTLFALSLAGCTTHQGSKVQLIERDGRFTLIADGSPYSILGVGGTDNLAMLASYGGNTIRTWDAEGIGDLLDEAESHGIRVVAGIWLEHERHGFDYDDPEQRAEELDRVERLVKEHRDHPALLAWGIGNEVELGGDFDVALRQINDAAAIVKRLDPHHPRMAVVAEIGDDKAIRIQNECPDINILGVNAYGGLASLKERLEEQGYTGAWAVTEWGVLGHWESGTTPWGAPYEPSSGAKADFMRGVYEQAIEPNLGETCLGSFAFLWGHKQEKTATWYGLMLPTGEKTERVDVLRSLWTGAQSEQRAPRVDGIEVIEGELHGLSAEGEVVVRVNASDPDGNLLDFEWALIPESDVESMGGDFEESIQAVDVAMRLDGPVATIRMPDREGAYRIFVTVRDGQGGAGTANLPVNVVGRSDS